MSFCPIYMLELVGGMLLSKLGVDVAGRTQERNWLQGC
uniref:Uncharacterized protein n=1 Tax=Arundo donax TaxID=35708 RepID=A0A0A9BSF5_ARUDO